MEWNKKSEEAKRFCWRCLHDAKVAAIKAELAAAAAKADEVLIDLTQKQNTFKNIKFGFFLKQSL